MKYNWIPDQPDYEGGCMVLPTSIADMENIIKTRLHNSSDLIMKHVTPDLAIFYFHNLTDVDIIQEQVIFHLQGLKNETFSLEQIVQMLPIGETKLVHDPDQVIGSLLRGWVYIHRNGQPQGILINAAKPPKRSPSTAEIETNVIGPQVAFTESLTTNTALIRTYISHPSLCNEAMEVGTRTRTLLNIMYVKDLADEQNVNTLRQRISELEFDGIIGSSILAQLIEDNSMTIFPQMIQTERPDRVSLSLLEGKIAVLVDGSPLVIVSPCTFWDFFNSSEDHYVHWNIGDFMRLLRMVAAMLSIYLTPAYVAALTFHYEIIPPALLIPLAQSRSKVPFPPLLETLFLEITIELLREAGVRLPTKVGVTMGIVGGIVIGQAAVQAGFTSNILIMLVALSALASFTTPSYLMGASIRFVRFPIIIAAGIWGGIGIMFGTCLLLLHLLRQTSLGHPYLHPLYPLRVASLKSSVIRLPFSLLSQRLGLVRSKDQQRFDPHKAKKKKDIDE